MSFTLIKELGESDEQNTKIYEAININTNQNVVIKTSNDYFSLDREDDNIE